jgi:hypothetical protein
VKPKSVVVLKNKITVNLRKIKLQKVKRKPTEATKAKLGKLSCKLVLNLLKALYGKKP